MSNSSLVDVVVKAHSGNYTAGRGGYKINHITVHHCLPIDETELLTPEGWKYLSDIEVGDVVMTSDERLNMKFDSVLAMVPVREDTVYDGRGIIATKEHRMLSRRQNEDEYYVRTLDEIFSINGADYVPNAGFANYDGLPLSDDEIEFLAMVQADGSMDCHTPLLRFYKKRKIERCLGLLTRLGYDYIEKTIIDMSHPSGGVSFRVTDKVAKRLIDEWLENKQFTWKMLYMSKEQAEAFADALTYWDGCRVQHKSMVERRYASIVQQNKDVVAAILAINGIGTNQTGRHLLTYKERLDRSISARSSFEERTALVSCVEVPSGFILIRQNGFTTIVGNCAGVLAAAQCGSIFAKAGRNGSANYGVGSDGKVGLYVNESDRAWADSNWQSNCTTVSIETSNSSTGGNWPVSAKTFDKLVLLVADIAKRNGLGKLVPGKNLCWHSMYAATACPGDYLRGKMQELANRANAINYPPAPAKAELTWTKAAKVEEYACNKQPTNLWNFDSTTWAGCKSVKTFNKGDKIDIYGSVYNKALNATYLLTEYSFTKKIANGFNAVDMDKVEKPAPAPVTPTWKDITPATYTATKEVYLYNVVTGATVQSYRKGTEVQIVQTTTWNGVEYGRTEWSRDNNLNNGFKMSEMALPEPEPAPEPEPTPEPTPTPEPEPEPKDPTVGILQKIIDFIKHIIDLITEKK